ncbi:four helix bundle protein [candidate division KSB1 bacterium]|nr:four helix bundle protein [candidate division KSB1 bacterium]RQW04190.1 MAG: four helix bundle protein [candidate division KSB1 bacterium]
MAKKVIRFEDLEVWKEGMRLARDIYKQLKPSKDFGLKGQMQRASVSIPSNIAEGFERKTNNEFIHFLFVAKGSCAELRTQLYLAKEIQEIDNRVADDLLARAVVVSKMLYRLIETRREKFS